jgi:rRNA maturation endonuclease Nob1
VQFADEVYKKTLESYVISENEKTYGDFVNIRNFRFGRETTDGDIVNHVDISEVLSTTHSYKSLAADENYSASFSGVEYNIFIFFPIKYEATNQMWEYTGFIIDYECALDDDSFVQEGENFNVIFSQYAKDTIVENRPSVNESWDFTKEKREIMLFTSLSELADFFYNDYKKIDDIFQTRIVVLQKMLDARSNKTEDGNTIFSEKQDMQEIDNNNETQNFEDSDELIQVISCYNCGGETPKSGAFCQCCGTKFKTKINEDDSDDAYKDELSHTRLCMNCGNETPRVGAFCKSCGSKVT